MGNIVALVSVTLQSEGTPQAVHDYCSSKSGLTIVKKQQQKTCINKMNRGFVTILDVRYDMWHSRSLKNRKYWQIQ